MKIVFYDAKPYDKMFFDGYFFKKGYEAVYIEEKLNADTVRLADGAQAVCIFVNDRADAAIITSLHGFGVRLILLRCAGFNNVDIKAAYKKIHVLRVPAYSPNAVAEHALALLMCVNRKLHRAYNRTRDFNFSINGFVSRDLSGKTAGVIGTGKIGSVMSRILAGIGMRVLAYDKYPDSTLKVEYVPLETLFNESDVISIHCPLTAETKHMINADSIFKMKKGVIIINTSRGGLVDTGAAISGLDAKIIGGMGLDVYEEEEEYFYEDFSGEILGDKELVTLLSYHNVLITSHQAFLTEEALKEIAAVTMKNISEYSAGGFLENEVCYRCGIKGNCSRRKNRTNCF